VSARHRGLANRASLLFDDCIISGVSLYTPSSLLVLAYRTRDDDDNALPVTLEDTPRRGVHQRQTGLSPELRLINMATKEEVDVDTLTTSRYESLSAADYHLGTLYVPPAPAAVAVPRGALEAIGGGIWDVGVGAARVFSSAASIRSASEGADNATVSPSLAPIGSLKSPAAARKTPESHPAASTPGLKLFIQSPYDCVLAVKRDLADHLAWLVDRRRYRDAFELVSEHPEAVPVSAGDEASLDDVQSTPTRATRGQSLRDFFADDAASRTSESASKARARAVEAERRRIGELWLQQLTSAGEWAAAGRAAGAVLGASPRWEHWVWTFAQAGRFDDITPYIPARQLSPPLPSIVYERLLGHYIFHDCLRFKELVELWDPELFNIQSVTLAIENKLAAGEVREDTVEGGIPGRDWRILLDALAKLSVADNRPKDALRCYVKLHDADAAMALIAEYHLAEAVVDDIPGFLTLRVPADQIPTTSMSEIEEATAPAIRLLVDEALSGIIPPATVVAELRARGTPFEPFLFLYLRALWKGHGGTEPRTHHRTHARAEAEGRALLEPYGDLAVDLFAAHDRPLLAGFLRASRAYSYDRATAVCEARGYHAELVYLLAQTGQTKRALSLIINQLGDVGLAIDFTREQGDAELWDDLLDFSMDKPRFIRGLLERVGTSVDPIRLVRRIPEGLEIEGLRDGVARLMREFEIQGSISEGVARVLRGEVAKGLEALRKGRAVGIRFDVAPPEEPSEKGPAAEPSAAATVDDGLDGRGRGEAPPGHCAECHLPLREGGKFRPSPPKPVIKLTTTKEPDTLVGFACGHVFHLACVVAALADPALAAAADRLRDMLAASGGADGGGRPSIGAKVARAHMLKSVAGRGCAMCRLVGD
jgi:hypothetical protein